ncbi:H/ACA ribonucleoprotein complex non-core subunit NAF1 [Rhizoctonia solani]|uniref:H/ACA ribonucleoprotein complex non-core subunit NAF1 n=1 Tax=Rhizoctonia solani TaxID=456999 RepID=A0A0K6G325_9AGAM|nr:H/ACA ribonucleoprotein complex non-core subunit NAF1 [Rhizoctonia solani]
MQSYVDVPSQPVKAERPSLAKPMTPVDSDEDEVELAIQIVTSDDEGGGIFGRIQNDAKISYTSSDDSDSSDSSSDVEMRVTKYPTRKQPAFQVPNDSDIEDDEVPSGSIAQYAGTKNEVLLPQVKAPELAVIPPEETLELIGEVMTVLDSVVVIKGYTSSVDRVLDTDSLLVFEDRNVFGVVFETFGAVKQPLYSVRFPSASAIDKDAIRVGRQVFHVPARSNFVFINEIARIKGSDASNLHDEEVGEDQLDFSDDEAEAQWRRNRKEAKRGQALLHDSTANFAHEGTPKQPKPELPTVLPYPVADDGDVPYSTLPYDDAPDPRPTPAAYDPYLEHEDEVPTMPTRQPAQTSTENEPSGSRGRGRDRGRRRGSPNQHRNDDRGRSRRRGGRGRGRGDRRQGRGGGNFSEQYPTDYYPDPSSMMYAMGNTGPYPYAPQDEGYNPVNGGNAYWDQGTMPHINPRFFSGELGTGVNGGFGMQWPGQGQDYGYQQPGYSYGGGYDHQNDGGYNHNYGNSTY